MKFSLHRTMTLVATVLITLATSMSSAQFLETVKRANPNVCVSAGNWDEFRRQYPALDIYANTFKRSHEFFAEANIPNCKMAAKAAQGIAAAPAIRNLTFYGHICYADNWYSGQSGNGLHYFTNQAPIETLTALPNTNIYSVNMTAGGVFANDKFYYINYTVYSWGSSRYLYIMDTTTEPWTTMTSIYLNDFYLFSPSGVAVDPTTGTIYGIFSTADGQSRELSTVDYDRQSRTPIATVGNNYLTFSINAKGEIYSIANDGNLYKLDKATGEATLVGPTGVSVAPNLQSATFDQKTGTLYWASYEGSEGAYASAFYAVDTATGAATKISDLPQNAEISLLAIPAPLAEDDAPAVITDLSLAFDGGSTTGNVNFTAPATTYAGGELSGELSYTVKANGETVGTGTAAAGEPVSAQVSVPASGSYEFIVTTANSIGTSPEAKAKHWIGFDKTYPAQSVQMELDEATGVMSLTWQPTTTAVNNGYVGDLKFDIVRYPDKVLVASAIAETSFTETLSTTALKNYYYGVTQINGDMRSGESLSNAKVIGQYIELPYLEEFSSSADFGMWTVLNKNGDTYTWEWGYNNAKLYTGSRDNSSDDWLITPPIRLENGRKYSLTFAAKCNYHLWPERIEAALGAEADSVLFDTVLVEPLTVTDDSNAGQKVHSEFVAPADGLFRIGFHGISDANMSALYIDNVEIVAGALPSAPSAPTNLVVTPYPLGELKTNVKFNAPTTTFDGTPLESISKIEVYSNYVLINTFDTVTPGDEISFDDETVTMGVNTYIVYAYNENGMGDGAKASTYAGIDIPLPHKNVGNLRYVVDNFDGTFTLHWPAPEEGEHGGYIDPDNIKYNVYERGRYSWVPYKDGITEPQITITHENYSADVQELINYGITPVSVAGEGSLFSSAPYLVGKNYRLPFIESFTDAKLTNTFWSYSSGTSHWTLDGRAFDGDGGTAVFTAASTGDTSTLFSGKIDLDKASNPVAFFRYRGNENATNRIRIVVNTDFAVNDTLNVEFTPATDWQVASVDLAKYADSHYIMFGIQGVAGTVEGEETLVDRLRIMDQSHDFDLAIEALTAPESVTAGCTATVKAHIANVGTLDANTCNATLEVYVGKRLAATTDIPMLNRFEEADVTADITLLAAETPSAVITANVVFACDCNTANNSATTEIAIDETLLESPWLTGDITRTSVTLKWETPTSSADLITEDFEGYEPFIIDGIGNWTVVDADGQDTYFIQDLDMPNAGIPKAFQVFNPYALAGEGVTISETGTPHSGEQCLISFNPAPTANEITAANDWLISPELNGMAQQVSFYAKSLTTQWGSESFEILFSTTDKQLSSFSRIGDVLTTTENWTEYTADLPQGTRYFAIRVISYNVYAFMLDDITFYGGTSMPVGYNIYRDKTLIDSVDADTHSYVDTPHDFGIYTWQISALYSAGESPLSNAITVTTADVAKVLGDEATSFDIFTIDGIVVGTGLDRIPELDPGIYIINNVKIRIVK